MDAPKDIVATGLAMVWEYHSDRDRSLLDLFCEALMAERERCAKIADPIHLPMNGTDYEKQAYDLRCIIASDIRTETAQEQPNAADDGNRRA